MSITQVCVLHSLIAWSAVTFGGSPSDIVERTLPLAGLAVQTVRRICRLNFIVNGLIDTSGTERKARTAVHRCAFAPANLGVKNRQV